MPCREGGSAMAELIVRGGRIVTARGVQAADVAIENGCIVSVGAFESHYSGRVCS